MRTQISVARLLLRPKSTFIQTKLPPELRERNVAGAFTAFDGYPTPRWFLIVDDVATTGSTLSAAGAALKNAYPKAEIWGVTVARG